MRMQQIGDGQCLRVLVELIQPILCPPAERAVRQFLRSHKIEYNPDSDEVLSVVKVKGDGDVSL